jgi:hypothetical protein
MLSGELEFFPSPCTLKSRKALELRISQICNDKNHQSVRRRLECVRQVHQHLSTDDEPKSSPSFSRPNQHQHTHEIRCLASFLVAVGVWRLTSDSLQGNGIDSGLDPSPNDLSEQIRGNRPESIVFVCGSLTSSLLRDQPKAVSDTSPQRSGSCLPRETCGRNLGEANFEALVLGERFIVGIYHGT